MRSARTGWPMLGDPELIHQSSAAALTGLDTVRVSFRCERLPGEMRYRRRKIVKLSHDARFGQEEWQAGLAWLEFSAAKQEHGHNLAPLSRSSLLAPIVGGLMEELEGRGARIAIDDPGEARLRRIDFAHDFSGVHQSASILLGRLGMPAPSDTDTCLWADRATGQPANLVIGNKSWKVRLYRKDLEDERAAAGALRFELELDREGLRTQWVQNVGLRTVSDVTDDKAETCARLMFEHCSLGVVFRPLHSLAAAVDALDLDTPTRKALAYAAATLLGSGGGFGWLGYGASSRSRLTALAAKAGLVAAELDHAIRLDWEARQVKAVGTATSPTPAVSGGQGGKVSPVPSYGAELMPERRTGDERRSGSVRRRAEAGRSATVPERMEGTRHLVGTEARGR